MKTIVRRSNILLRHQSWAIRSVSNHISQEKSQGKEQSAYFDFVEHWSRDAFFKCGYGITAAAGLLTAGLGICQETVLVDCIVGGYWALGYHDITQKHHTILRNFPVLGNTRYLLEMIRPEIRQYFVEADDTERPFDRSHRSIAYQRAKDVRDTLPFGTRRNVYDVSVMICCDEIDRILNN